MIAYLGFSRATEVEVAPIDLGCGAGQVQCFECGGDGDWTKFHPDESLAPKSLPCVDCKGTGKVLVSI
ncbi:MAG TPA: hypothetical protein VIU82_25970 [Bosea sp. (in: a-proteobacteria)]